MHPEWSPDGSSIAFVYDNKIALVDVATGGITYDVSIGNGREPRWSPDGNSISFFAARDGGGFNDIWMIHFGAAATRQTTWGRIKGIFR